MKIESIILMYCFDSALRYTRAHRAVLMSFGVPFLVTFFVYLYSLAPTVTFEDSGELIAAAFHLGIPHQPGYPLFTVLGRLFCHLPFDPVAYRMNMMSAFFGAVSSGLLSLVIFQLIKGWSLRSSTTANESSGKIILSSIAGGMLFSFAFETWEQSVITEVYSLHHVILASMLLLLVMWKFDNQKRNRWFFLLCYTSGLSLANHHLSLAVFPACLLFIIMTDRFYFFNRRLILIGFLLFFTGVSLYAYLPVASFRDPVMDWGNPDSFENFMNTILRQQYQTDEPHSWTRWLAQLKHYGQLLWTQWPAFVLIPACMGMLPLFRAGRIWLVFTFVYFAGTIALTIYVTNFDVRQTNPVIADENKHLVSVFYTSSYLMISLLAGTGLYQVFSWLKGKTAGSVALALTFMLLVSVIAVNISRVNMRHYRFAEHYAQNVFSAAEDKALILTNYDPHHFSIFYYQLVEGLRPDLTIIDITLLRSTWYMDWLMRSYPVLMKSVDEQYRPYRSLRDQSGKGLRVNPATEIKLHAALVNAMIDTVKGASGQVHLTFDPPGEIASDYLLISTGATIELCRKPEEITSVHPDRIFTDDFTDESIPKDRMARFFMTYYGRLLLARAVTEESMRHNHEALAFYEKSYSLMIADVQYAPVIRNAINRLKKN